MVEGVFIFFYLRYGDKKHKNYKNLVSMLIHGGLIFRVLFEKGSKDDKKNDIRINE
jgi:hypothetical protein